MTDRIHDAQEAMAMIADAEHFVLVIEREDGTHGIAVTDHRIIPHLMNVCDAIYSQTCLPVVMPMGDDDDDDCFFDDDGGSDE